MTYATSNPPALASQRVGADGGAIFIYKDGDPVSTVTGINYVTDATDLGMKAGDRVIHIDETIGVTTDLAVTAGATTGTASGGTSDTAGYAVGIGTVTAASAGTGTLLIGDVIVFDSDPDTEHTLSVSDADISGGATLTFLPVLAVAIPAAATGFTVKSDVLNLSSGASGLSVISGSAAAVTLSVAESGSTILFDRAAGLSFTLPPAAIGLKYKFETTVDLTAAAYAVLCSTTSAGDFMVGAVNGAIEGAATGEVHFANGTTHLGISSNKTTTGGLIGGWLEFECLSASLWSVKGTLSCTATPATPFTT